MIGKLLLDDWRVDCAIQLNSTSSSLTSKSFSIKDTDRVAVIFEAGPWPALSTGDAITCDIVVGNATVAVASMTSLAAGSVTIGSSSTKGTAYGFQVIDIYCLGSVVSTGLTVEVNGTTFTGSSVASSSGLTYLDGVASSLVVDSLSTLIAAHFSSILETTVVSTGTTAAAVRVTLKDKSTTLRIATTAATTIAGLLVRPMLGQAVLEFGADELISANSSYTNFAVRINSTGSSAIGCNAWVLRKQHFAPNSKNLVAWQKDLTTVTS